ncbi:MAG: hypothetical protein P8J61_02165 [Gammaproteobacteria bacterium]|nr:hypothetical protein [Gammaproteobacteria bacterium]
MNQPTLDTLENIHSLVRRNSIEVTEAEEEWTMPPNDCDGSETLRDD